MSYCDHIRFETFPVHEAAESARRFFGDSIDPDNYMKRVLGNDTSYSWSDYSSHVGKAMLPWITFFAVALLVWILSFVFIVIRTCCCRRKAGRGGLGICVLLTLALCLAVMGLGTACLVFTDMLYQGIQQSECAAYRVTSNVQDGNIDQGGTFIGLSNATIQLAALPAALADYDTNTDNNWSNTDWLTTDPTTIEAYITTYQSSFEGTLLLPNPNSEVGGTIPTIYGQNFITACQAMSSNFATTIGLVDTALNTMKGTSEQSKSDVKDLVNSVDSAESSLQGFYDGVKKMHSNVDKWFLDNSDNVQSGWAGLLLGFTYLIISAMLCFLLISCLLATGNQGKGRCFYLMWLLFGISAIGGAALAMLFVGTSIIMKDACGVTDNLSTTAGLQEYSYLIPSKAEEFLNVCFNTGGDVAAYLGISKDIANFDQQLTEVNQLLQKLNAVDLTTFPGVVSNQQYVNYIQASDFTTNYDAVVPAPAPSTFLATLNLWTNSEAAGSLQVTVI